MVKLNLIVNWIKKNKVLVASTLLLFLSMIYVWELLFITTPLLVGVIAHKLIGKWLINKPKLLKNSLVVLAIVILTVPGFFVTAIASPDFWAATNSPEYIARMEAQELQKQQAEVTRIEQQRKEAEKQKALELENQAKAEAEQKKREQEEARRREEEEQKKIEEEKVRIAEEKQKQQEEDNKRRKEEEQATKTNKDVDYGTNLGQQDTEAVKSANKSIANFGDTTRNKQLFTVTSVVDGDTIKIEQLGTLRLIGIDTPETKHPSKPVECFGREASEFATSNLLNQKVYLEFDPAQRIDKYNRTLAYVFREDGFFYNKEAVNQGYAFSYTKYPHPRLEEFNSSQSEARNGNLGLWSASTCNGEQKAEEEVKPVTSTTTPVINITPTPNQYEPTTPASSPQVQPQQTAVTKLSRSGICHAPGSTYYSRTKNFTSYNTLEECLRVGRLPKR